MSLIPRLTKLIIVATICIITPSACVKQTLKKLNKFEGDKIPAKLVSVIDGDSLLLKSVKKQGIFNQPMEVRLIGVDAPEYKQHPWGIKALQFSKRTLQDGCVMLEFDKVTVDKYGRKLAYVYTCEGKMLNESLLENGYAVLFQLPNNTKHAQEFKEAEAKARAKNLNIWDQAKGIKMTPYEFRKKNKK